MASIKKRADGTWRARYRDNSGRERARHFAKKSDAQTFLDSITAQLVRGDYIAPERTKMSVAEWADRWLRTKVNLKPSTLRNYGVIIDTRITPRWGRLPLSRIEHDDVAAWIADLTREGLSPSWVRQIHRTLSMLFDAAVKGRRITVNPAKGVDLPRLPRPDKTFLTHEQLADLADACAEYRTLVYVLGYCGLRFGEAAGLRVKSVDLLRGRLHIVEAMTEVGGRVVFGTPKTHAQRSVPVPRFLRDALAEQLAGKEPDDFVFPAPREVSCATGTSAGTCSTPPPPRSAST